MGSSTRLDPFTTGFEKGSDDTSLFEFIEDPEGRTLSTFCHNCQWMMDNWSKHLEATGFRYSHHNDIFQLKEAAFNGCSLCYQFWRSIWSDGERAQETMNGVKCKGVVTIQPYHSDPDAFLLSLMFLRSPIESGSEEDDSFAYNVQLRLIIRLEVLMLPALNSGSKASFHRPKGDIDSNTKHSLALVARWLDKCRRSHWKCNNSASPFTPTRLVSTKDDIPRLCLGTEIQEPIEYATLSHCWGEAKFPTLTKDTLEAFRARIPHSALSQTFSDAIQVSRYLGISYLWIDSLCIIQDDLDDWKREATSMSAVYGDSILNIAASGAVHGGIGCFSDRPHHWRCHVEVGDHAQEYVCVPLFFNFECLSNMPLMSRGWALQERLLAPRTVHFTTTEVFWECYHKTACESFPDGLPSACRDTSYFAKQPLTKSMWIWIVENYSKCNLTYPEDKLSAISGLARCIHGHNRDQYAAGMWRDGLEIQLCWQSLNSRHAKAQPYIAPTWSWASMNSSIYFPNLKYLKDADGGIFKWIEIVNIRAQPAGPDPFGALSGASLQISCTCLLHIEIGKQRISGTYMSTEHERVECYFGLDYFVPLNENEEILSRPPMYALPVIGKDDVHGLILQPTNQEKGQFRRIGYFTIREFTMKSFERALAKCRHRVYSEDCSQVRKDKFGKTHYIIELV